MLETYPERDLGASWYVVLLLGLPLNQKKKHTRKNRAMPNISVRMFESSNNDDFREYSIGAEMTRKLRMEVLLSMTLESRLPNRLSRGLKI